jgi:hypothetical protein
MSTNAIRRSIEDLGPGPHEWKQAAEQMAVVPLSDPLRHWVRESGLPGAVAIADDGSWLLSDQIRFLKILCGEPG